MTNEIISNVHIGTSGFYYQDWTGTFYPENLPPYKRLNFYADHFGILEINYSYYRMPDEKQSIDFIEKTKKRTRFSLKANRIFTHGRNYGLNDINSFSKAVRPFIVNKLFIGILFQFPYSFKPERTSFSYIECLRRDFSDIPFFIEFRDSSWYERNTLNFLYEQKILLCSCDYPRIRGLPAPLPHLTGDYGYIRFHGRNDGKWYDHDKAYERYDYNYTENELLPWLPKLQKISKLSKETFVFFNNHYNANAVTNAKMLERMILNKY